MLARSGQIPTRGQWAFEFKWDGFRAVVRTGDDFRVRSRRGWDMTALLALEELPALGVFDGELVSFDGEGRADDTQRRPCVVSSAAEGAARGCQRIDRPEPVRHRRG